MQLVDGAPPRHLGRRVAVVERAAELRLTNPCSSAPTSRTAWFASASGTAYPRRSDRVVAAYRGPTLAAASAGSIGIRIAA